MNISPISNNNNSFNGTLIVKNFKTQKTAEYILDNNLSKNMIDTFAGKGMLNKRFFRFAGLSFDERLQDLKKFVKFFDESSKTDFEKDLTYPATKDFEAIYRKTSNSAEIDIPNYFKININL